jgi:hypothetical protein
MGIRYLTESESKGITIYYSLMELTNTAIPRWEATNAIPVSPDKAVVAAIEYANSMRPQSLSWDVDHMQLLKFSDDSCWFYIVDLIDRKSGRYESEVVRILMNGKVWKPEGSKK